MNDPHRPAEGPDPQGIRGRFERAFDGEAIERPNVEVIETTREVDGRTRPRQSSMASGFWRFSSGNATGPPWRCDSNTATIISVAVRAS